MLRAAEPPLGVTRMETDVPKQAEDRPEPTVDDAPSRRTRNEENVRRITHASLPLGVARFGGPLVLGMALHTTFNLIDMFMVSRLAEGAAALAALGICDMLAAVATILSNGISTATVAIIARRTGARDLTGVRRATWQSMLLVGALSVVFGAIGLVGSEVIVRGLMQAKGQVADIAVGYLQIILGGCYSIFFLLQITAILRALGHAKSAASLLIGGNVLNVFLGVGLIYGPGPYPSVFAWAEPIADALGIPRFGALGAAWATLIGRTVPVLIGAGLLLLRKGGPKWHSLYLKPMWSELRSIVRIGWPSSAQLVLRVSVILVFISLINANYTTAGAQSAITAYSICLRLETMALFIGMGWGAAASTYVGVNLGAGLVRRAKNSGWIAAGYNVILMCGLTAVFIYFAGPIVGFFDAAPSVLGVGREYLTTVGLTYCAIGVGVVLSQGMTGAGATLSSLVLDAAVLLLIVVPGAFIVTEVLAAPRIVLWYVIGGGNVLAASAYAIYYARGSFLAKRI